MACQAAPPFRIENNILIAEEYQIGEEQIGDRILNAFKSNPEFIGQVDATSEEQSTYRQMRERSVKCAIWMKRNGIKRGDIIVICTHNQQNAYVPFLASLYIGVIANPWNDSIKEDDMEGFLKICPPRMIFINNNKVATVRHVVSKNALPTRTIIFGQCEGVESLQSILNEDFEEAEIESFSCVNLKSPKDTAIILFTSGITETPKAVEIPHAALMCKEVAHMSSSDVALWFGSLSWISSVLNTLCAIQMLVKVVKFSKFEKERICHLIEKHKVTWVMVQADMCNRLFKSDVPTGYDVSSLKTVICIGSALRHAVREGITKLLPNCGVYQAYDVTELGCLCAVQQVSGKINSSGYVTKNVRLMIADLYTGIALGPNMRGEICCKSPTMMNSHFNYLEARLKATIDNNGWFHTGDLGYYDEDGDVFVVDRIRYLIKYKGNQVSPSEIETVLHNHPAVYEAIVVPLSDIFDQEHPVAVVKKRPGSQVTERELVDLVTANLGETKTLPRGVQFAANLRRTHNGKIDVGYHRRIMEVMNV